MRKNIKTLILSIVVGTAFVFFVRSDLLRKVPGFYCEGFGCAGLGVVYFFLALLVIPLFFGAAAKNLNWCRRVLIQRGAISVSWKE